MPDATSLNHRRTHSLLLLDSLLTLRPGMSPLNLVLDSLEQPARPVLREYVRRRGAAATTTAAAAAAAAAETTGVVGTGETGNGRGKAAAATPPATVYVSFETPEPQAPRGVTHFIQAAGKGFEAVRSEIEKTVSEGEAARSPSVLVILDTLHPLLEETYSTSPPVASLLTAFLTAATSKYKPAPASSSSSSQPAYPPASLIAVFHTSVPLALQSSSSSSNHLGQSHNPYAPSPLALLTHLATTIITPWPLHHELAERRMSARALPKPHFGLAERRDGVLMSMLSSAGGGRVGNGKADSTSVTRSPERRDVVLRVEHRRKSGRAVLLECVLCYAPSFSALKSPGEVKKKGHREAAPSIVLLSEHPSIRSIAMGEANVDDENQKDKEEISELQKLQQESTFSLSLTEKQRQERDAVILPFMDAQRGDGPGLGGRILYQMGEEDFGDFDEDEDEI